MLKYLLSLILSISSFSNLLAQTGSDTLMYYVTKSDIIVTNIDSADHILFIMPMKEENGQKLFPVFEYYPNGKQKLVAASRTNKFPLIMEGLYLRFFPNGKRQSAVTVQNGQPVGDELSYYPNGKFYSVRKHEKNKVFLIACKDSTGRVLAENGNGEWLEFDGLFKTTLGKGLVKDGMRDGEWLVSEGKEIYKNGVLITTVHNAVYPFANLDSSFVPVEAPPEFPGGLEPFSQYVYKKIKYPPYERENGIQGKAYISFVVERDGSLTDFKIVSAPSKGLGEEALRLIKDSPKWKPGIQNGRPVRVQYTVPVNFVLGGD
jgi:TonB family protein